VVAATLRNDAGIIGAAIVAIEHGVTAGPLLETLVPPTRPDGRPPA
jgi:hypothetical protein